MVLNEVGSTIIMTMFSFLPDFYCFLVMFQSFLEPSSYLRHAGKAPAAPY